MLVGPAGAGKTTWAREHLPGLIVGSDELRAVVGEGPGDLRASTDAFAVLDDIVVRRLRRRLTTVIDTLGTDVARRERWRAMAEAHGVPCIAVLFDVPATQLRARNRARAERVPDAVLRAQITGWSQVVQAVRAEPFGAVHDAAPAAVVAPSLVRTSATRPAPAADPATSSGRPLRFGLQLAQFTWPGGPPAIAQRLRDIAVAAEAGGVDSLWVMDHFRQIPMLGPAWDDLESWTTLAYLAACTSRVRLGTLVTGITYRNVAHLAKIVATLDVLSGGRVDCGIGLGWYAQEHVAYGWEFPSTRARYALLEDALQLLPRMWGPGAKPFDGAVLHVPDTSCYPRPVQQHVPVLVGGSGERRTLRLVARYADACNLFGSPEVVAHKVRVLHQHCTDLGRDPAEISVTHLSTVLAATDPAELRDLVDATRPPRMSAERHARNVNAGTVEQHVDRVARLRAAGVDHVIVSLPNLESAAALSRWQQVIATIRQNGLDPHLG